MRVEACQLERRSKHLVVHSGVTAGGDLSDFSAIGSIAGLTAREVVGHLSIELLDSLLLGTSIATTTALSTATGLSSSACGTRGSLLGGSRLGLVLLGLAVHLSVFVANKANGKHSRNTVGKGSRAVCGWNCASADQNLDADRATVNLDTVQCSSSLRSLVVPVEDNSCTAYTAASGVVLQENLLRSTYVDG